MNSSAFLGQLKTIFLVPLVGYTIRSYGECVGGHLSPQTHVLPQACAIRSRDPQCVDRSFHLMCDWRQLIRKLQEKEQNSCYRTQFLTWKCTKAFLRPGWTWRPLLGGEGKEGWEKGSRGMKREAVGGQKRGIGPRKLGWVCPLWIGYCLLAICLPRRQTGLSNSVLPGDLGPGCDVASLSLNKLITNYFQEVALVKISDLLRRTLISQQY